MSQSIISTSFEHADLSHLLKRREFRRLSDSRFRRNADLNDVFRELTAPALSYKIKKIEHIENDSIHLQEGTTFTSPILAKVLEHCEEMICFIVTIGSALEKEAARLNDYNRLTEAYILDRLGSLTAEHTVNAFHDNMKRHYRNKGYGVTLRFSPGYCDWPITEQQKLFLLIDTEAIGVTMTESCLMHPRKSISGVFGLFSLTANGTTSPYNPCVQCGKRGCNARRQCVV